MNKNLLICWRQCMERYVESKVWLVVCGNILRQIKCFVLNIIRFSQTDFVVGNIDMVSMEKKNTFPTHQVRTCSCIEVYKDTFWSDLLWANTLFYSFVITWLDIFCTSCWSSPLKCIIKVFVNNELMLPFHMCFRSLQL